MFTTTLFRVQAATTALASSKDAANAFSGKT